jgi:threonine dehydratase
MLNNGDKFESMYKENCSTKGLTTNTSLQYAKYLTEKYGKELFVKKEIA